MQFLYYNSTIQVDHTSLLLKASYSIPVLPPYFLEFTFPTLITWHRATAPAYVTTPCLTAAHFFFSFPFTSISDLNRTQHNAHLLLVSVLLFTQGNPSPCYIHTNAKMNALLEMVDTTTIGIICFFLISAALGHQLLHRVIKTPAQYRRPDGAIPASAPRKKWGRFARGEKNGKAMGLGWICGGYVMYLGMYVLFVTCWIGVDLADCEQES